MAEFKLRLPDFWDFKKRHARTVHVVGLDGIPWPCRGSKQENLLIINRNRDESGKVFVAYPFGKYGELTIATGTLPESDKPYDLVTELARGTLNRLRNQTSIWQEGGLQISDEVVSLTAAAVEKLSHSIMCDASDTASKDSSGAESLELAMDCVFELSRNFGGKISIFRAQRKEFAKFWFAGSGVIPDQAVPDTFSCWEVPPSPSPDDFESTKLPMIYGPFLDASSGGTSAGYDLLEPEFEPRRRKLLSYCQSAVEAMEQVPENNVSILHAVSGLNGTGHRNMSFPQQMQLATDIFSALEKLKKNLPIMASFDFPWAERLASSVGGTHPLQIADSLLRQGLQISYVGLEINLDYWPAGSVTRDPLQWIDLIDVWSQLGLPLVLLVRIPQMETAKTPEQPATVTTDDDTHRFANIVRGNLNDAQRCLMLDTVLPMMIARPNVHGVIWRQWQDADDQRYPMGGLMDPSSNKKHIFDLIQALHSSILQQDS